MGTELIDVVIAILSSGPADFQMLHQRVGFELSQKDFLQYLQRFSAIREVDGKWELDH